MIDPKDKQVRERLVARGVAELSDEELLSVLLGDGGRAGSALDLAGEALSAGNGLAGLARLDLNRLRAISGMGVSKAALLAAAFEAGRRVAVAGGEELETITTDADVERIFRPLLGTLPHEEFWVVFLSASNRVMEKMKVSQGGVQGTVVDHKLIVKRAVERLSPGILVVHNHPSGAARPSKQDLELTRKLETAASLFDITLLDHVIITASERFSFRKAGLIGNTEVPPGTR